MSDSHNVNKLQSLKGGSDNVPLLHHNSKLIAGLSKIDQKGGKTIVTPARQSFGHLHLDRTVLIPSNTTVSANMLTTASRFDFRIPKASFGNLKKMFVRFRVAETGGANSVTPAIVTAWIDMIRVYADNGSNLLRTKYGAELYFYLSTLSTEEWTVLFNQVNSSASYGSGTAIAANGTRDYYLPLFYSVLEGINFKALANDVVIQINTRPTCVASGTGTLSLSAIDLLVFTERETESKSLWNFFNSNIVKRRYLECVKIDGQARTITAGQNNNISLTNLNGKHAFIVVGLRAADSNASNGLTTYTALEASNGDFTATLDVQDEKGTGLLSDGNPVPANQLRYIEWINHFKSPFPNNVPLYLLSFCNNAKDALEKGIMDGGIVFNGTSANLVIRPNAAFVSGTYFLDVLCFEWRNIYQEGSKLYTRDA